MNPENPFDFAKVLGGHNKDREDGLGFPTVLWELECLTQLLTASIQEIVVTHLSSRGRQAQKAKVMSGNVWWSNIMLRTVLHCIFPINTHTHTFQHATKKRCNIRFLKNQPSLASDGKFIHLRCLGNHFHLFTWDTNCCHNERKSWSLQDWACWKDLREPSTKMGHATPSWSARRASTASGVTSSQSKMDQNGWC